MKLWDWLFERERKWAVLWVKKGAFLTRNTQTDVIYTHNLSDATRFSKSEAKRLARELGWLHQHIYIEAE